jgi:cobalt/nickel transport system permease protein
MAHLHLPDGVLPFYLWAGGYAVVAFGLFLLWLKFRRARNLPVFARAGFFAALMIVAMSFHVAPLGYHLNLAALAGIVAGPTAALLACLFANVILALLGHGGVTVVGLNTLTLGVEALVASVLFSSATFAKATWFRAFGATVLALAASTALAFAVVAVGTRDLGQIVERGRGGLVEFRLLEGHESAEGEGGTGTRQGDVSLARLAALFFGFGAVGWALEGTVTATVCAYLKKTAPRFFPRAT